MKYTQEEANAIINSIKILSSGHFTNNLGDLQTPQELRRILVNINKITEQPSIKDTFNSVISSGNFVG